MKLVESIYTVHPENGIQITINELNAMGISSGAPVVISFLSTDGTNNLFNEFLVFQKQDASDSDTIFIPDVLLSQAGISVSDDVNIACIDGVIIVFRQDKQFSEDELLLLENDLGVALEELKIIAFKGGQIIGSNNKEV